MCGIVGSIGFSNPKEYVAKGLKMLDYRGYDSAGIAYFDHGIKIHKDVGSVEHLMQSVPEAIASNIMIGHTRWATHGAPTKRNTHPHLSFHETICLVHNGVIDNYKELKAKLTEQGYRFYGETDSEVVANLLESFYLEEKDVLLAIQKTKALLHGSYAIAFFVGDAPDSLYVMKKGSPLVVGKGKGFNLVASDASPMIDHTNDFLELEDGEFGFLSQDKVVIYDEKGNEVEKTPIHKDIELISHDLKGYPHYMLKEIEEIP